MKNVYVYCEGQTEESFVNYVLYTYLFSADIIIKPIVCETKRTITKKYKGGVSGYDKIRKELSTLCKQHKNETVTTMFDYYAIPRDTPGIDIKANDIFTKVAQIEKAVEEDIGTPNLLFNLTVHEFEGLLFSKIDCFETIADKSVVTQLDIIKKSFLSPEHINDSTDTAPSKRLLKLIPAYAKVNDGTIIAAKIGIVEIMRECQHFREWISKITSL